MLNSQVANMETIHFLLRSFEEEDLVSVHAGLSNPEVIKYYGVSYTSLDETREQMRWFNNLEKSETGKWWAICSKDNTAFYGAIGINDISTEHKKGEVGYWLIPDFWGRGIISEVLPVVIAYAFETLHIHRIEAYVETENKKSKCVLDRHGFIHEGTMHECEIKNGRYISLDVYALLSGKQSPNS